MKWILLISSLPTGNATVRMRAWRALKTSGAVVLRDGVYLMPDHDFCKAALDAIATDVISGGGSASILRVEEPDATDFASLFKRNEEFTALLADVAKVQDSLSNDTVQETLKQTRKLRKVFATIAEIDFFPGEAQAHANAALQELELNIARVLTPDEPHAMTGSISRLAISDFQGRRWATRCRPWVDRLACAWLIRRFIDPQAQLLWLTSPDDCPADALGFDFDGATFSHVANRVSFEVLLESFGLDSPALRQLCALVHYLDVGGIQPPESVGIESVLAGMRTTITGDDQLVLAASSVFDGLLATFQSSKTQENPGG
ncbi:chromate resistance protein [Undibacterium sp. Jales W-56]|uniref:chromate resistance protein n=1 Tax=Undibacterium sp. Jales W-56 TaxID=2897325 RepID=UPI0021D179A9|nr:chromate resistance protein [Undibacterium sp. Jales W-56]MCU6433727.1 chromate resistance protein [Undibacterium sp. Jales W-56]